jgi:TRAP-type C4-dicarboxylate transport system permease small subunit
MKGFFSFVSRLSKLTFWVAGVILIFMMLVTVIDVGLRYFGKNIPGTYELVCLAGALLVCFAIAQTSLEKGHIFVDLLLDHIGPGWNRFLVVITKIAGSLFFLLVVWSFLLKGNDLRVSKEVLPTLRVPFYPIVYGLSLCCIVESLVLFSQAIEAAFFWKKSMKG